MPIERDAYYMPGTEERWHAEHTAMSILLGRIAELVEQVQRGEDDVADLTNEIERLLNEGAPDE